MHKNIKWIVACAAIFFGQRAIALAQYSASPVLDCGSPAALVVVTAERLPALLGAPIQQIELLHYREHKVTPITVQIDRRDHDGHYHLQDEHSPDKQDQLLESNDEIVFRLADAATRIPPGFPGAKAFIEIKVADPQNKKTGWVYANATKEMADAPAQKYITYKTATDRVESEIYNIRFSSQHPFIMDRFQWKTSEGNWSQNVLDVMKIRHQGDMFGFIPFSRTTKDYSSQLTRVKAGPLRVIRRTENRVRILLGLKTPAVYIDYVMMPDGFVMDTIIDIPFNLGLLFDDLQTITTIDWRNDPALPELSIHSPGFPSSLEVNGKMTDEKRQFNTRNDTRVSVHSDYGAVFIQLHIPDDFPITPWLYLADQADIADPPENQPGQFGNVGYRTTGWENIDTEVHHLKVTTCLTGAEQNH